MITVIKILTTIKNIIKKYRKIILPTLIFIIILLIICHNYEKKIKEMNKIASADSIYHSKDATGHDVVTLYRQIPLPEDKKKIDSLEKLLKIKPKEVISYIQASTKANYKRDTIRLQDTILDDTHDRFFQFNNPWVTFTGINTKDSVIIAGLETRDTLSGFFIKKIIGKHQYNSLVLRNSNPYTVITNAENFSTEIPREYSPWAISVTGGIDLITRKPSLTIGITRNLIRFKRKIK